MYPFSTRRTLQAPGLFTLTCKNKQMETQEIQNTWRKTFEAAKNAAIIHKEAIKQYQARQAQKNWYPDYDLCAATTGAQQALYGAYQELQSICLQLYNAAIEQQNKEQSNVFHKTERLHTGTSNIKQAYWQYFFKMNALNTFAAPTCPTQDRENIIALMQKDLTNVPELQTAIDYLTNL